MSLKDLNEPYSHNFFKQLRSGSKQSAAVIIPLVLEWINAQSVVDVGCGDGTWLSVFKDYGVNDVLGLDGSYVTQEILQIPVEYFKSWDLSQPICLNRVFDLALSLEVAEHLPEDSARNFVKSLICLSDVVLFSAAIPGQGGTNHINEQWPSYWITLFEKQNYIAIDALRERIWNNPDVQPWYAQNSFLFVKSDCIQNYPVLESQLTQSKINQRSVVHPTVYLQKTSTPSLTLQKNADDLVVSGEVQILDLIFLPFNTIQSGEELTIEIHYQMKASLEKLLFTLSLSNEKGEIYLDTEFAVTELQTHYQNLSVIQLNIKRLDLVKGNYFINPGIFSLDWSHVYDFHWQRYPLKIESLIPQKGTVYPPMHWQIPLTVLNQELS